MIGGWGGQRVIIRRKQGANVLREVQLVDILANDKWIAFLIQITTRTAAINCFFFISFRFVSLRSFSHSIYHSVCCFHFSLPSNVPRFSFSFSARPLLIYLSRSASLLIFILTSGRNSYMKLLMHLFIPFDFDWGKLYRRRHTNIPQRGYPFIQINGWGKRSRSNSRRIHIVRVVQQ